MEGSKVLPDGLKHGAEDEDVVEDGEADQDPVEAGWQTFAQEDGNSNAISSQADHSDNNLPRLSQLLLKLTIL